MGTHIKRADGSILADDPSFFKDCSNMILMDADAFIRQSKKTFPELPLMNAGDNLFMVTNRGIQIRVLLCPYCGSKSIFRAYLPCWGRLSVTINLDLWNSNYIISRNHSTPPSSLCIYFDQIKKWMKSFYPIKKHSNDLRAC